MVVNVNIFQLYKLPHTQVTYVLQENTLLKLFKT